MTAQPGPAPRGGGDQPPAARPSSEGQWSWAQAALFLSLAKDELGQVGARGWEPLRVLHHLRVRGPKDPQHHSFPEFSPQAGETSGGFSVFSLSSILAQVDELNTDRSKEPGDEGPRATPPPNCLPTAVLCLFISHLSLGPRTFLSFLFPCSLF